MGKNMKDGNAKFFMSFKKYKNFSDIQKNNTVVAAPS